MNAIGKWAALSQRSLCIARTSGERIAGRSGNLLALALLITMTGILASLTAHADDASDRYWRGGDDFAEGTLRLLGPDSRKWVERLERLEPLTAHDEKNREALDYLRKAGGAATLYAMTQSIRYGDRKLVELPLEISRSGLPGNHRLGLLMLAVRWMRNVGEVIPNDVVLAETEYSIEFGSPEYQDYAWMVRLLSGDPGAAERRARLIRDCVTKKLLHDECLPHGERHSASTSMIAHRWDSATPEERIILTLWSRDSHSFLLGRLLEESDEVQAAILVNGLPANGAAPAPAIKGAILVLERFLESAARVKIHGGFIFNSEDMDSRPDAVPFPLAMQAAFDELATYPEAFDLMQRLGQVDHPWIATHAGVWLFHHDAGEAARRALRFTQEYDGLPSASIIQRLATSSRDSSHRAMRELLVIVLQRGSFGKWASLTDFDYHAYLSDPEVIALALDRTMRFKDAFDGAIGRLAHDRPLETQLSELPFFLSEVRALQATIARLIEIDPKQAGIFIGVLADSPEDIWRALAMAAANEGGDYGRSKALAAGLAHSRFPRIAEAANSLLMAQ